MAEESGQQKNLEVLDADQIFNQIMGGGAPKKEIPIPEIKPPVITPQETTSIKSEAGTPPDAAGILKEIFGDQFTSVEDLKNSNIPERLKEIDQLRQLKQSLEDQNKDLSGKLNAKPKSNYANDDIALFNEFVKDTKINSFDVFNRLNKSDVATMDYKEAIILARLMETPELLKEEPRLRKHVEKTYNVDTEQIDEDEAEINKYKLAEEGLKAKAKLQEFKNKLKLPVPEADTSLVPSWTPEKEAEVTNQWSTANKAMGEKLSKIPIYLPNTKEAFINFAIPEETQKAIQKEALEIAINNHMEIDDKNITTVARYMYSELIMRNLDTIAHSIFEKARSLSQEEARKLYHNPTPLTGGDSPAIPKGDLTDEDELANKIYKAEIGRI